MTKLVNGNSEFGIYMTGLNMTVSAGSNMGIETNAAWNRISVFMSELFEDGNVINIDDHSKFNSHFNFFE
jgi:hypothetical protein